MARGDRPTAQSEFERVGRAFGKKGKFAEVFPGIADIVVTVTQPSRGLDGYDSTTTYTIKNPPGQYGACNNPACVKGGVRLGLPIGEMVQNKETEREFEESCIGYEGSEKGRKRYRECLTSFKVKIKITYA